MRCKDLLIHTQTSSLSALGNAFTVSHCSCLPLIWLSGCQETSTWSRSTASVAQNIHSSLSSSDTCASSTLVGNSSTARTVNWSRGVHQSLPGSGESLPLAQNQLCIPSLAHPGQSAAAMLRHTPGNNQRMGRPYRRCLHR